MDLDLRLFERDTRGTHLTAAGRALLEDVRGLLRAAAAVERRAHDAAGQRTFTIGFTPGVLITPAIRELSHRHPDVSVALVRSDWIHQTAVIRDGQVDVGYLRLPTDVRGLAVQPLFSEPRVVMLPAEPEWRDIALELRGKQARRAIPRLRTIEEKLEYIAAGNGIVVLPLSAATFYHRPGITHALIGDIAPSPVCVAWDRSRHSALIDEYVAIVLGS